MEVVAVGEDVVGDVEVAVGVNVVRGRGGGDGCGGSGCGGGCVGGEVEVAIGPNQWLQFHFAVMSTCGIIICI